MIVPIIEKDDSDIDTIIDLSEGEKVRWRSEFGAIRSANQETPSAYIDKAVEKLGGHDKLRNEVGQTTDLILRIRETAWNIYIQHEQMVCGQALEGLLKSNAATRGVLRQILESPESAPLHTAVTTDEKVDAIAHIVGELSGRTFPYTYELAKSVTQSRRSRAGKAFERIIRHILDIKGFPCDDQSRAGGHVFEQAGLGKIVDGLLPGLQQYNQHRAKCAILTMKTTLRERWQEVVEELHRTNVPHIYLLTLDDAVSRQVLDTMRHHNITLVAPINVKERAPDVMNLISFEQLFNQDLPHLLQWWEGKM